MFFVMISAFISTCGTFKKDGGGGSRDRGFSKQFFFREGAKVTLSISNEGESGEVVVVVGVVERRGMFGLYGNTTHLTVGVEVVANVKGTNEKGKKEKEK